MLYKRLSIWNSIQKGFQRLSQGTTDQNQSAQDFKILSISDWNKAKLILTIFGQFEPIGLRAVRGSLAIVAVEIFETLLKWLSRVLGRATKDHFILIPLLKLRYKKFAIFLELISIVKCP